MPYELLFQSKIIQISRAPARYIIPALLCLAILAAIGVQSLQERRAGATTRMRRLRHGSVVGLIVVALSFELLPAPALSTPPTPTPSFFVDGTLRDAGAILEVPNPSNQGMYYATLHGRPVLYGELSRDNPAPPMVDFLRHDYGRDDIIADSTGNWYCVAWYYRVTHAVIYHHLEAPEDEIATTTRHERLGPAALVRDTPEAALYRLPTPATGAPETCLVLGTGWGTARPYGDGQPLYRWTGQQASIDILRATPGRVRLHFNVHSFARPRRLQVRMGEQIVEQAQVGGSPQPVAVTLDVPAGRTRIELRSVEPALSPAQFGYTETEPIAIGVSQFRAVQEH
jgi:hypothetical protein